MEKDYRKIKAGERRFNNPEIYKKSLEFQKYLLSKGIAWHNVCSKLYVAKWAHTKTN